MSDISLGSLSFDVNTAGLKAGSDELTRFETRINAAAEALAKMEARAASAMSKVNPAIMAASGGSGTSGWDAHAMGVASAAAALDGFTVASGKATAAAGAQGEALRGAAAAHKAHGAAAHGNALQMMEFAHIGRALFDEMAAGGSVLRGLAMEFGRLQIAVTSGEGGISGALGRIGSGLARFASPAVLGYGAIAAAGAASAAALYSYESTQDALERSTNGIGRRSGASPGTLDMMARRSAVAGGLSTSEAYDLAARYNAAGLAPGLNEQMLGMTRTYARVTGSSIGDAGGTLAKAAQDPLRGLAELDKSLGFVDDRLRQQVTDLERSGRLSEAQSVAVQGLNRALADTTVTTWGFSKAMESTGNFFSNAFSGLGHTLSTTLGWNSDADKLAQARETMANLQKVDPVYNAPEIADLKREIARLQGNVSIADAEAAKQAKDARDVALSGQAGDAVRSILPDIARSRSAADTLDILRQAMADPAISAHMDPGTAQLLGRAYGNAAVMQGMSTPGLRQDQDYRLRLQQTDAFSTGENAVVAARRAELDVLRQTGDVMNAARSAQQAYNEVVAKSNSDAEDRLRKANQDFSLIGLSPFQRAMQELKNKYEGDGGLFDKDEVSSTKALSDPTIRRDFADAAKWTSSVSTFTSALDTATARLASFPAGGAPTSGPYGALRPFASNAASVPLGGGFDSAVNRTLGFEGGLLPRDTNGTPSKYGINAANNPGVNLDTLTIEQAKEIYRTKYWNPLNLQGASDGLQRVAFDTSVMEGPARANQFIRQSGGDASQFMSLRQQYEAGLIAKDPAKYGPFQKSWALRDAGLNADLGTPGTAIAAGAVDHSTMTVRPGLPPVAPIASTTLTSDQGAYAKEQAGVNKSFLSADPNAFGTPLGEANRNLTGQIALMKTQAETFEQSTEAIKGAAAAQQLWNSYARQGVTPTGDLAARIRDYGAATGKAAQDEENRLLLQKQVQDIEDAGRSGLSSSVSGGLIAAANGKPFGSAFKSGLHSLGERFIGMGTNDIFGALLGQPGKGLGTGFFGSLFGGPSLANLGQGGIGHNAGGTTDWKGGPTIVGESGPELVQMPAHAQVMTAGQTSAMMAAKGSPTINVGGHSIVVQGNADEKTLSAMDAKIAQANEAQYQRIVRNLPQIQSDSAQWS